MINQCSVLTDSPVDYLLEGAKLRVDFAAAKSVTVGMTEEHPADPNVECLIEELLTCVGMMMEDASVTALVRDPIDGSLRQRVEQLERSSVSIHALIKAAKALNDG